ncbi:LysR family transcriptional regulator [bacterium]|nr:LysR family transcriptional regulator [bacterium]
MNLDWSIFGRNFHYFIKCAQIGNISRASKAVGLTQASLSLAIKNLEDEIGEELFKRMPRGVSLTATGEALFSILSTKGVELEEQVMSQLQSKDSMPVKIGYSEVFMERIMSIYKGPFKAKFQFYHNKNKNLQRAVEDGLLEFAFIVSANIPTGSLLSRKIRKVNVKVTGLKSKFPKLKEVSSFKELKVFPWVTTLTPLSDWNKSLAPKQEGLLVQSEHYVKKIILEGLAIGETYEEVFSEKEKKLLTFSSLDSRFPQVNEYLIYSKNIKKEKLVVLEKIIKYM